MLEAPSDTLLASSLLSNSRTLRQLDEVFTVLRLFFAIAVGYTFNCEKWFVADSTRRTEVGKGNAPTPASFQACLYVSLFSVPAQAVNSDRKYIMRSAFLRTGPLNGYYKPMDDERIADANLPPFAALRHSAPGCDEGKRATYSRARRDRCSP